jgi:hypothetical protein
MIGTEKMSALLPSAPDRVARSEELGRPARSWVVDPPLPSPNTLAHATALGPKGSRSEPRSVRYDLD